MSVRCPTGTDDEMPQMPHNTFEALSARSPESLAMQVSILNSTFTCQRVPPKPQGQPGFLPSAKAIIFAAALIPAAILAGVALVMPTHCCILSDNYYQKSIVAVAGMAGS